ncbi:hypothetical protein Droror1_Dr00008247 [Drosera rotundifolia]
MARITLILLMIILLCSQFITSSSTRYSWTRHLLHDQQQLQDSQNTKPMSHNHTMEAKKDAAEKETVEFQLNDYAPAGANPEHTPLPP